MKKKLFFLMPLLLLLKTGFLFSQSKPKYLNENKLDLRKENASLIKEDFKVIGFGAYHGSAKTYEAEQIVFRNLLFQNLLDYYIIEANYSQAFFFRKFLENNDADLLKSLCKSFQNIVRQEGTVETYNHWKDLKRTYDVKKFKVLAFDIINEYEFPIRHILEITNFDDSWPSRKNLEHLLQNSSDFSISNQNLKTELNAFIIDYDENKLKYENFIKDSASFNFIINNIRESFGKREREKIVYRNFLAFNEKYNLNKKKLFFKYGFFHVEKDMETGYPSFFTRLIKDSIYQEKDIKTIIGYLTNSEVLWKKTYIDGKYSGFKIEKGFGIGDYYKEYFQGVRKLKRTKVSDLTLFKLNNSNSPYHNGLDLIEVRGLFRKRNAYLQGKNTLNFIDYALLISDSAAQVPIEELSDVD
jgi:hypothetical protein